MSDAAVGIAALREGDLLELVLSRPPLNILRRIEMDALSLELERAVVDPELRFVAIRAQGAHFCAGADVGEHLPAQAADLIASFHRMIRRLRSLPLPTFALVHGRALGAGCELAMACDFVLAEEGASFGQPEIKLGVFAPAATVLLPLLVGPQRARELLLGGESIDAALACDWGLLTEVVGEDELAAALGERLKKLRLLSRSSLAQAKQALLEVEEPHLARAFERVEHRYLNQLMASDDAREGLSAFLEKRAPQWRHR